MAQHDFVPSWLNFSTPPQSAKSPTSSLEKHGESVSRGDGRPRVSRRRHNSSDGFFNNDLLTATAGDGWHQPSLLRHDSVDSGVSKGGQGGLAGGSAWKDPPVWAQEGAASHHHTRHPKRGGGDRDRERTAGHRHRNGNFHPRKGAAYQDKLSDEEHKEDKLKFVEEDFPSLNPEAAGKQTSQARVPGTPSGVWENPPSAKQTVSKMLIIKKVSKEDPCTAFSAGFASTAPFPVNGSKAPGTTPSVYKNLVPKPAAGPNKTAPWKPNVRETKSGAHFSGRDSAFTSPVLVTKPMTPVSTPVHTAAKELPSSVTPLVDITPSRLKLMRRGGTDRKSEFLRALKDESNGEVTACYSPGTSGEVSTVWPGEAFQGHLVPDPLPFQGEGSTPEPKEQSEDLCQENGVSHSFSDSDTEHLSSSLEAEHRLLKAMGWQEYPENDDNFLPLTEEELKEFKAKTEQLKRNGLEKNGALTKPMAVSLSFPPWRGPTDAGLTEGSESETSSSQTSDDDN